MKYFNIISNYIDNPFNACWLSHVLNKNPVIKDYEIATSNIYNKGDKYINEYILNIP